MFVTMKKVNLVDTTDVTSVACLFLTLKKHLLLKTG